ncbi:MAG: phage terminase large subunit family protein [Thaumarchaeota archaeon]|nr:phage terminase large subunit family protein [Nitrososphaerota archaeon]
MAQTLKEIMLERLVSGLKRTAVKSPSKWAELYRELPTGRWSFKHYPWLRDMHDSTAQYNVGQKSAQMGFTETLLNLTFYGIDIRGFDCLYLLPNKNPDASDFSSGRFGPALALSTHLQNLFTDTDNVGHKRAGAANLYVRGSQSRSGLKGLPINYLMLDEVAEFVEANIPLAFARTDGQLEKLIWLISTPTYEGNGIGIYWEKSDKRHFFFKCPGCSRRIELKFPDSMVMCGEDEHDPDVNKSHLQCYECKVKLPHETKHLWLGDNLWVPETPGRDIAGFTISQLYSHTVTPQQLVKFYYESLHNVAFEVEFFNSKLGVPHIVKGHRVNDDDLDWCILHGRKNRKSDQPDQYRGQLITMGVDVGPRKIHYEIAKWDINMSHFQGDVNSCSTPMIITHGTVEHFEELDYLMQQYGVVSCIIDGNPERRKAAEFAKRFYGRVRLCFFGSNITGKTYVDSKIEYNGDPVIRVDRTTWLDQALGRFINRTISLPTDTDIEYRTQVKEPVKSYKKDGDGNPVATYITSNGRDDHYAFSRCYNEMALMFVGALGTNQDI